MKDDPHSHPQDSTPVYDLCKCAGYGLPTDDELEARYPPLTHASGIPPDRINESVPGAASLADRVAAMCQGEEGSGVAVSPASSQPRDRAAHAAHPANPPQGPVPALHDAAAATQLGLFTCNIWPPREKTSECCLNSEAETPYLEWAEGGEYTRIHRPTGLHPKRKPALEPIPDTNYFDEEYLTFRAKWRPKRRAPVGAFNKGMRLRMMRFTAKLNKREIGENALFITLTYPGEWEEDWMAWQAHLNAFRKRFERKYGVHAVLWRLERQTRGAPHFHLLVFDASGHTQGYAFKRWLSRTWFEIVGSGDRKHLAAGTQVKPVAGKKGAALYCAKYASKEDDHPSAIGRRWGIWNKKLLPIVLHRAALTRASFMAVRRALLKWLRAKGYARKVQSAYAGVTVFLREDDAAKLAAWAGGT